MHERCFPVYKILVDGYFLLEHWKYYIIIFLSSSLWNSHEYHSVRPLQIIFFPLAALNFNHYVINLQKFYLVLFPYILGHFTVIVSFLLIFSIPFLFLDILNTHILHSVSKINKIWSIWRPDSIVCFFLRFLLMWPCFSVNLWFLAMSLYP